MASRPENILSPAVPHSRREILLACVVWMIVIAALVNVLCFAWGTANPVLRSDDWYFFDVFVRKAIDGTLSLGDFFVKRSNMDHAQPLSKLVLWFDWRYLDLDLVFESIVGAAFAFGCGLILHRLVMASRQADGRNATRQLAWGVMCVLLLSLNSSGVWTWPLVALGYLTILPALVFVWAAWNALRRPRYGLLAAATLVLGIVADDSAIIVVASVLMAMLWVLWRDSATRRNGSWKVLCTIVAILVLVRIGYAFAPVVGGEPVVPSMVAVSRLVARVPHGDWWHWLTIPLASSVAYKNPFEWVSDGAWSNLRLAAAGVLLLAHIMFWRRAFRGTHNLTTFSAVCLMLLSYAWLAGVLVYRVSSFGTEYLYQARYVQLYVFNLLALLLMWAGPHAGSSGWRRGMVHLPVLGCVLLLAIQVPLAQDAWRFRPYLLSYYREMAMQVETLGSYPGGRIDCVPILPICDWQKDDRARALLMLRTNHLNVFSPRVQRWHLYLPQTNH